MNIRSTDIIIFTLFRDDNPYSSVSLSIGREFAKNNRVFYINHPYSVKDVMGNLSDVKVKERINGMLKRKVRYEKIADIPNLTVVVPPMTLPINWMKPGKTYDRFNKLNNKVVSNTLKQVIKDYDIREYIYYNCFDPFFLNSMPKDLPVQPLVNVYQCIDDLDHDAYTAKHGVRLEKESVRNSDLTLVTATKLQKKYIGLKPETHIMNNAVDISIFKQVMEKKFALPAEMLPTKGKKVIGFTGNLDHLRINYNLFKMIAEGHPEKMLVIVGPINCDEFYKLGIDKMPNVITTGAKKITELPQYVQHFDVAIIPFALNDVTKSIYPLKINEYLAAGRSVIATDFSDDIRSFGDYIHIAKSEKAFVDAIDKAIFENNDLEIERRVNLAKKNTWADRVDQFWRIIEGHLLQAVGKKQEEAVEAG
jgi:teichuronic acid biosynthesis glycosyltransferase TuaH